MKGYRTSVSQEMHKTICANRRTVIKSNEPRKAVPEVHEIQGDTLKTCMHACMPKGLSFNSKRQWLYLKNAYLKTRPPLPSPTSVS